MGGRGNSVADVTQPRRPSSSPASLCDALPCSWLPREDVLGAIIPIIGLDSSSITQLREHGTATRSPGCCLDACLEDGGIWCLDAWVGG